jgi:hypothetical protein
MIKKIAIFFGFLLMSFALFSQNVRSVNANFQDNNQGWEGHFLGIFEARETRLESGSRSYEINNEPIIKWSSLLPPMDHRYGISFSGKNYGNDVRDHSFVREMNYNVDLLLFIQKEVAGLKPNTNYRVTFNMNWVCQLEPSASPIFVKVGAINQEPMVSVVTAELSDLNVYKIYDARVGETPVKLDRGEIGRNGRDLIVAERITPSPSGHLFLQNANNLENPFFVNTDDKGRLFLMIAVETEGEKIENVFLSTLRILLAENGEAREMSNVDNLSKAVVSTNEDKEDITIVDEENPEKVVVETILEETSEIVFIPRENNLVFFESEFNNLVEMVNIYTEDNHLMKLFSFRNPSAERVFQTMGLSPGTYRIEFILNDGRIINKMYIIR